MNDDRGIARVAGLLADPARATIVHLLIDGTTRPAGELAHAANISAQSASGHLSKLVHAGLLALEAHGRHRYFRLASAEVADALESLTTLGAALWHGSVGTRAPSRRAPVPFLYARTCYDHLAGEIAVRVCEAMLKAQWLSLAQRDFHVTPLGERKLAALGVDVASARQTRRVFARACVDLTERRPHLGGALGAALLGAGLAQGWILRRRHSRTVTVTPKGGEALKRLFG